MERAQDRCEPYMQPAIITYTGSPPEPHQHTKFSQEKTGDVIVSYR